MLQASQEKKGIKPMKITIKCTVEELLTVFTPNQVKALLAASDAVESDFEEKESEIRRAIKDALEASPQSHQVSIPKGSGAHLQELAAYLSRREPLLND